MAWLGVFCLVVVGAAILVIAGFILAPLLWFMTGLIAICYLMSMIFDYAQRKAELRHQERMRVLGIVQLYILINIRLNPSLIKELTNQKRK